MKTTMYPSVPSTDQPSAAKRGARRWLLREILGCMMVAALLFIPAGRLDWPMGWALVALYVVWVAVTALLLMPSSPALLAERVTHRFSTKPWDNVILGLYGVMTLVKLIVAGLALLWPNSWSLRSASGSAISGGEMVMKQQRPPTITIEELQQTPVAEQGVELVERKGVGHPDSICDALTTHLRSQLRTIDQLHLDLNTLDARERGEAGIYLTVLGTSAEGGDCGQVGRGNKVNGVIALNRPMGTEAATGKNPISHVGKIYTLLSHQMADEIYRKVAGLREVYVWLCSQIGQPIDQPLVASAQVLLQPGVTLAAITPAVNQIIEERLATIHAFTLRLARGELAVW